MARTDERVSQLVIIGSSAGGIDALSEVVRTLPPEMPAPVLIAQHLDPSRPSHLTEILRRQSRLRVETVGDRARLEPNTILVLPPGQHAEVTDHEVRLTGVSEDSPRPSIDALFSSASQVFGDGLIGVILTGTGHDGAAGARDIKTMGGTVVVQNPATASYSGMPLSIDQSSIDIVAELEAIGPLLYELVSGTSEPSRPDEERLLRGFLDQLRERTGIDFASYKRATIMRRLQRRMVATGSPTLRDYIRYVQANPDESQRLTGSFLIKVTEFFRDRDLFEHLRDTVIPALIKEARENDNELRIWSAGCATGEEAYSLAILIVDALGDELGSFHVRIFATDVDAEAIAVARRGVYPESAVAGLPRELVERHFNAGPDGYEVRKTIRGITVFGQHDLGSRAPFPRVDLALCRNVLIYFTTDLQRRALQLFAFALRDGGYLVLGKAESTTPLAEYFVLAHPRLKVYRRQGERVLIPPTRIRDLPPTAAPARPGRRAGWIDSTLARSREAGRPSGGADYAENLLLRLPIGVVVVDRKYDIQSINAQARRLLAIHGAAIGNDLVHLVPAAASEACRTIIDATFRGEVADGMLTVPVVLPTGTELRSVRVTGHPLRPETAGPVAAATLLVEDVTQRAAQERGLEDELARERAERVDMMERGEQIAAAHAGLIEANTELTTDNAVLRSANEELLVANEEVQAATEEVETLNEELQATNEELETLNEELQATVEELNTTNDDLQARSMEAFADTDLGSRGMRVLLSMTRRVLEEDRPVGILSPDPEMDVSNRSFRTLFDGTTITTAAGEAIPEKDQPLARARRGERFETEVTVRRGRRVVGRFKLASSPLASAGRGPVMLEATELT